MTAVRAHSPACSGRPDEASVCTTGPTGALPPNRRITPRRTPDEARRPTAHAIPVDDPTQSRSDPQRREPSQSDRLTPRHRPSSSPLPVSTLTRTRHWTFTPLRRAPIGVPRPSHRSVVRTDGPRHGEAERRRARSPDRTHALTLPAQITPVQSIHARDPSGWGGPLARGARAPTGPLSVDRAAVERRQHE